MSRAFIDLIPLADLLREKQLMNRLERQIRRFHGKASVRTDLDAASRSIGQLRSLMGKHEHPATMSEFEAIAGEALCAHAVVTYCRALVTQAQGRRGTAVRFSGELVDAHERVLSLRNRRLCHYGQSVDEHEAGWSDDRALLALDGSTMKVRFATSRYGWDVRVVRDLEALLSFALPIVDEQATNESDRLLDEFESIVGTKEFVDLAAQCKFDPKEFFASIAQAEAMDGAEFNVFEGVRFGTFVTQS